MAESMANEHFQNWGAIPNGILHINGQFYDQVKWVEKAKVLIEAKCEEIEEKTKKAGKLLKRIKWRVNLFDNLIAACLIGFLGYMLAYYV